MFGGRGLRGELGDVIAQTGVKHGNDKVPWSAFVGPNINDQLVILLIGHGQIGFKLADGNVPVPGTNNRRGA